MLTLEVMKALSPIVVLVSVMTSAYMIMRQMRLQYDLNIRNKSLSYSLYANEHLRDARIKVEEKFGSLFGIKEAIPMDEIRKRTEEDNELYASILTLLAHWENMALSIHSGIADDDVCFEMVASTLIQHVKVFRNFIESRREGNPRIYDHLMTLRRNWEERLVLIQRSNLPPLLKGKKVKVPKKK